ncbi:MAG: methyltransferase [Myxococcaceae bacterium]|nr:methyltransferase [Myxococcaceae bacterium]
MSESVPLPEEWLGSRLAPRELVLCPELRLWLLGDDVDLHQRVSEVFAIETAPYWAFCWGSGQALARYVLDHPELVRGLDVVDFGAGCGVAALAALKAGARSAVAVDIDPHALEACERNAVLNGLCLTTQRELPARYDVLLASDVLYELGNRDFLQAQRGEGRTVLVSDPLRRDNPRLELVPRCRYDVTTMPDVDYPVSSAVIYQL